MGWIGLDNHMAWYVSHGKDESVNAALRGLRYYDLYAWLTQYGDSQGSGVYKIFGKLVKRDFGWDPDRWEKWDVDGKDVDPSEIKEYHESWLRNQAIGAGIVIEC